MKNVIVGLGMLSSLASPAFGDETVSFMPPNQLHLQKAAVNGEITEKVFNEVIDEAIAHYQPIIASHGGTLKFNRLWTNGTVNASANRQGRTWVVNMYGGLARRPEVTKDGFALVVCHELGHHLGGFPFTGGGIFGGRWAANEGQSDYFATLSCARDLWQDQNAINAAAAQKVDAKAAGVCNEIWSTDNARNLCYRIANASLSLATLLANGEKVAFDTPDQTVVNRTANQHPNAQCRLDTYMAGARCVAEFDKNVIPQNLAQSRENTCDVANQYTEGTRPRCWYAPR